MLLSGRHVLLLLLYIIHLSTTRGLHLLHTGTTVHVHMHFHFMEVHFYSGSYVKYTERQRGNIAANQVDGGLRVSRLSLFTLNLKLTNEELVYESHDYH